MYKCNDCNKGYSETTGTPLYDIKLKSKWQSYLNCMEQGMPIKKIVNRETAKEYNYCLNGEAGPISTKLYQTLKGIQEGEVVDKHGWNLIVE